jgi:hypothetical protein
MRGEEPSKWTSSNTKRFHLGKTTQSDLTLTFSGAAETAVKFTATPTFLHMSRNAETTPLSNDNTDDLRRIREQVLIIYWRKYSPFENL